MKKIDLGQTAQLLAHIAVIAGIVFLAIEVSQNNRLTRSQVRTDIALAIANLSVAFVNDSDMVASRALSGDLTGPESLTPIEQVKARGYIGAMFRLWENTHYQYRNGLFDEEEYVAEREAIRGNLTNPLVACTN